MVAGSPGTLALGTMNVRDRAEGYPWDSSQCSVSFPKWRPTFLNIPVLVIKLLTHLQNSSSCLFLHDTGAGFYLC